MKTKNVYIIAGPNGSGKTTFAREFLPEYAKCKNFINADLIAQGLSPFSPEIVAIKSGKIVLQQIQEYTANGADFAFETTLAGKTYLNLMRKLKNKGYKIHVFFLWIPTAKMAIERIKDRVADGGHNILDIDVKRRFLRSIRNFFMIYKQYLDSWMLFDNSGIKPEPIVRFDEQGIKIIKKDIYDKFIGGISK